MNHISKKTNYRLLRNRGFTLIEVLIASLIFVVVISVAVGVFVTNASVGDKSKAIRELSQSARYGLEAIAREARDSLDISVAANTLTITDQNGDEKVYQYNLEEQTLTADNNNLFPDKIKVLDWTLTESGNSDYPLVQINLQLQYDIGKSEKATESYTQTYQTSITNRVYPEAEFRAESSE